MNYKLEQLIDILLHKSEQIEDEMKLKCELKNLTTKQLICIEAIKELQNPTLSELSVKLEISKASVSVMLDRLEENSYLYKIKSDNDRRSAHVHLTKKGNEAALLHTKVHHHIMQMLTAELTEAEKEILVVLLNKALNSFRRQ